MLKPRFTGAFFTRDARSVGSKSNFGAAERYGRSRRANSGCKTCADVKARLCERGFTRFQNRLIESRKAPENKIFALRSGRQIRATKKNAFVVDRLIARQFFRATANIRTTCLIEANARAKGRSSPDVENDFPADVTGLAQFVCERRLFERQFLLDDHPHFADVDKTTNLLQSDAVDDATFEPSRNAVAICQCFVRRRRDRQEQPGFAYDAVGHLSESRRRHCPREDRRFSPRSRNSTFDNR